MFQTTKTQFGGDGPSKEVLKRVQQKRGFLGLKEKPMVLRRRQFKSKARIETMKQPTSVILKTAKPPGGLFPPLQPKLPVKARFPA